MAFLSFLTLFLSIEIESSDCIANDALPRIVVVTSLTAISRGNPMCTAASIIASIVRKTYCRINKENKSLSD